MLGLQFQAMAVGDNRLLQMVEDPLSFVGGDGLGVFACQLASLFGGQCAKIEMSGDGNRTILAQAGSEIAIASVFEITLAMPGTSLIKRSDRSHGRFLLIKFYAG